MQIGHVYFCQQSTSPNVCARKRFIPQEAINISIPGADENWVCYRPGEMTRLAECNCRLLVPLTPARLIVLHDERSNIFYYVQLGTCDFMVILGSLMLLQMQRFSPLPHYVDSSVLPSGLFLFLPWKQKQMGKKNQQSTFFTWGFIMFYFHRSLPMWLFALEVRPCCIVFIRSFHKSPETELE